MSDDREEVAEELRRVREAARRQASETTPGESEAPSALAETGAAPTSGPRPGTMERRSEDPAPPDTGPVNEAWRAESPAPRGLPGRVRQLLERLLGPRLTAQQAFNARQVQLDDEIIQYLERRFETTHLHYDRLLGELGQRLDEADERHRILEKELVGHVHDLVRRIDLVLTEGSRGRLAQEFALEEVRARLTRLEKVLRRPE